MGSTKSITSLGFAERGASQELVVILHGWTGIPASMVNIRRSVEAKLPDADILEPSYAASRFSNTDPIQVALALDDIIAEIVRDRPQRPQKEGTQYKKIILVGFSIGALILRQVYLNGRGITETFHREDLQKGPLVPRNWVSIPVRIILLAGMNRGWSISPRPEKMKLSTWLAFGSGISLARAFGVGQFVRSAQRGAPFVANLRVRWALLQLAEESSIPEPEIYQLLGTKDDLVSEGDNTDLFLCRDFIFIPIVETDHVEILQFDNSLFGSRRREIFEDVVSRGVDELRGIYRQEHERVLAKQDLKPETHVVFLMHGIRDFGRWTQSMADIFHKYFPEVAVRTAKYRYFPMGAFLLLNARQKYVRWFMDLYTQEIAKNPAVKVSFVGHSNGSYILASAMQRYRSMEIHNVVFAGSVVPRDYPWSHWKDTGRVAAIQNYVAAKDWVVAIFPRLFELVAEITPFKRIGDIGSAGFNGFLDPVGNQYEHIVQGGHSGALNIKNHDNIALFIVQQVDKPHPDLLADEVNRSYSIASKVCWLIWLFLAAVVLFVGKLTIGWLSDITQISGAILALAYAFTIWLLLETI